MRQLLRRIAIGVLSTFSPTFLRRAFSLTASVQSNENKLLQGLLTMWGSIANLKRNSFAPRTVIDVGAYVGEWTQGIRAVYPESRCLMVEANPDNRDALEAVGRQLQGRVSVHIALLGAEARQSMPFYVVGTGSSVLREDTSVAKTQIVLPMFTLDQVAADAQLEPPIFLKLDVQGYELEVLRGGLRVLGETEVALLEVSLIEYNQDAPLFADVVEFMNAKGFVLYDICGQHRRQTDHALFQVDVIFVRKDSHLRTRKRFWNSEHDVAAY